MRPNWTNWIKSEEGKRAANFSTLYPYNKEGEVYLENRLWTAFAAGAAYERDLRSPHSICTKCGRTAVEHSREALASDNPGDWKWNVDACPVGAQPFHPTQTFSDRGDL